MRHRKAGIKLNRTNSHRKAMFRNMVTSLFKYERIRTTGAKAKELRRWADHIITLAKRGDLHARRQALSIVREKDVVHKLFEEAAERFGATAGGYTRIVKLGRRPGDAAPISLIELIAPEAKGKKKKAKKKAGKAAAEKKKAAAAKAPAAAEKAAQPQKEDKIEAKAPKAPKKKSAQAEPEKKADVKAKKVAPKKSAGAKAKPTAKAEKTGDKKEAKRGAQAKKAPKKQAAAEKAEAQSKTKSKSAGKKKTSTDKK